VSLALTGASIQNRSSTNTSLYKIAHCIAVESVEHAEPISYFKCCGEKKLFALATEAKCAIEHIAIERYPSAVVESPASPLRRVLYLRSAP
jgi:hypothetical protein